MYIKGSEVQSVPCTLNFVWAGTGCLAALVKKVRKISLRDGSLSLSFSLSSTSLTPESCELFLPWSCAGPPTVDSNHEYLPWTTVSNSWNSSLYLVPWDDLCSQLHTVQKWRCLCIWLPFHCSLPPLPSSSSSPSASPLLLSPSNLSSSPCSPPLTSTPPPPHLAPPSLFFSFYRGSFGDLSDKNHYYHLEPLNHLNASVRRQYQHIGSYMH